MKADNGENRDLLRRIRLHRDADAFEEFLAKNRRLVRNHARKWVRDDHLADDVIQEVFLQIWRKTPDPEARIEIDALLARLAKFKAVDLLRKRGPHRFYDPVDFENSSAIFEPSTPGSPRDARPDLWAAVEAVLPPNVFRVVFLRFHEDICTAETAQRERLTKETVKWRLIVAKKILVQSKKTSILFRRYYE